MVFEKSPELGVGGILGANLFNLAILGLFSLLYVRRQNDVPALNGLLPGLTVAGTALLGLAFGATLAGAAPRGWLVDAAILVISLWGLSQARTEIVESETRLDGEHSLKSNLALIALFGVIVVLSGLLLADTCAEIVKRAGMSATLVGALFMGTVLALPEIVVVEQLLRQGQFDLARANVFGASLFNLAFLAVVDLAWSGSVYAAARVAPLMLVSAGLMMTGLLLAAVRPVKTRFRPELMVLLALYGWVYYWLSTH
ncbi:MAG: Sodium/calcium exchanger protein [Deltaproteobacteria bacterium ADurb.Bin510]|nr:MAG: Sodium/calcium exchanger protein [Deltaproteobacteria bacterium ADurb.Bin510]